MADGRQEHGHHEDPTFYRSPRDAAAAPPEKLAYVAAFSRPADKPDAIAVVDVDPESAGYGSVVALQTVDLGDQHQMALELHPAHDPTRPSRVTGPPRPRGYQRPRCTTSSKGRRSGRRTGVSSRPAG